MMLRLWWIELRLAGTLLLEVLLEPRLLFVTLYIPVLLAAMYLAGGAYVRLAVYLYCAMFLFALYRTFRTGGSKVDRDKPLVESVPQEGGWRRLWDRVAQDMRVTMPASITWVLSPLPWRHHGCDAAALRDEGNIVVPLGCIGSWTMLDAFCHVAHARVRRRPVRLLRSVVEWELHRLSTELYQAAGRGDTSRRIRLAQWVGQKLASLAATWDLLADMEADNRIAQAYGVEAVSRWIVQSQLAYHTVTDCVRTAMQTVEERGLLIPIAASCKSYQERFVAGWQEAVNADTKAAVKGETSLSTGHAPFRLLAMSNVESSRAAVFDPRLATTTLDGLEELEERVVRRELGLSNARVLTRVESGEVGSLIVLPQLREDLERNAALLEGRTWLDLPDLVANIDKLGVEYKADARYLFAPQQRAALVPQLLAAFLAFELEKSGWKVSYWFEEGLVVEIGDRRLLPGELIAGLRSGELTTAEYMSKIQPSGESGL
ncbi:MAG: hypothetical protein HY820_00945 [Acidobacteria bacterium]|nr:hypothetical protein [Acidobacteriota bacterium]